ncbi:MAG: 4-carboxy-4-hydroxy-2-oxoadipate aldolase/oxaloacetate decarboxylase, partial [Candidatus Poribacteria bacterium]|nr:4-carboxy-4-hydroxy-2-oxoadipate aldolase/oxaloacetate decarboxylase [Candidatus Poribacteria bacterium]
RGSLGEVNVSVRCGGTVIHPGDVIVGDTDGVAVVPKRKAEAVLARAQSIVDHEEVLRSKVASGVSQVEIYNLDEQFESLRQTHEE